MSRSENCVDFGEDIASIYDETRPFSIGENSKVLLELSHRIVSTFAGESVVKLLDAGTGTGRLTIPLAMAYDQVAQQIIGAPHLYIHCVDRSEAMLEVLRRKLSSFKSSYVEINVDTRDIRDLHLAPNSYDVAIAHWIFHVIFDWRVALYAIERALKTQGLLVLFEEKSDLYDAIDGDLSKINYSRGKQLWTWYHELRREQLHIATTSGALFPARSRFGTLVVDRRVHQMFRALGWKIKSDDSSESWQEHVTLTDIVEKVIRPRAFTNMRLFRDDEGRIAYEYIANQLLERMRINGIEASQGWRIDTHLAMTVLERARQPVDTVDSKDVLMAVLRDTIGRRHLRKAQLDLDVDDLWQRIFSCTWNRMNTGANPAKPLVGLGAISSNIILAYATAPFVDNNQGGDSLGYRCVSSKADCNEGCAGAIWRMLASRAETHNPVEIILGDNPGHTGANRDRSHQVFPYVQRFVVSDSDLIALREVPYNEEADMNLVSPDAQSHIIERFHTKPFFDLIRKAREHSILPLLDTDMDRIRFLFALALLSHCLRVKAAYLMAFRHGLADVSERPMGLLLCAKKPIVNSSLNYLWTLSDVLFSEYLEDKTAESKAYVELVVREEEKPTIPNILNRVPEGSLSLDAGLPDYPAVLLVVATQTELDVLQEYCGISTTDRTFEYAGNSCIFLGSSPFPIWAVKCQQGDETANGASVVVGTVLANLNTENRLPYAVIMPGIAFGLKYGEQQMGDVLVSARLGLYERSKITEQGAMLDPNTPEAERFLVNHFETCSAPWRNSLSGDPHPTVHSGLLLSGEKLVNSRTYVEQLRVSFPKAIGGEMEGRAVYKACTATKTPWILAKGICDWGFGKTDDFQHQAAKNSLSFVFHALEGRAFKDAVNKHRNTQESSYHQASNKAKLADAKSRAAD